MELAMREKVYQIISQLMETPVASISENSSGKDIVKWDSLKHMDLMMTLEEEFGIQFTDEEIVELDDVKSILKAIQQHI
jgi:acyl carrier protein